MKDYRKFYKNYYGIDFGKDFEVHHLDGDRTNNDISNLLLLPEKLHAKYHFFKNMLDACNADIVQIKGSILNGNSYYIDVMEKFLPVIKECNKWYDYKLFLDGLLPDMHGFSFLVQGITKTRRD